ncbi:MAG: heme exporter protein CcmB [Actinomycetota bacterium]|nr:heme exporter protein CcmB [Actinomycetota bacterium]
MSAAPVASAGFIGKTWALVQKDVRIELRGRDTLPPMVAFGVAVGLLLAFALPGDPHLSRSIGSSGARLADVVAGFFWVTVLFAGLIGFARTFDIETEDGALDALLLVPIDRSGLYMAKALSNLAIVIATEVVLLPVFAFVFGLDLGIRWLDIVGIVALVDVGFAAVGTLFASIAAHTRSRELLLPLLALPVLVPIFIAAVELSSRTFLGGGLAAVKGSGWFVILVAYDIVFAVASALIFEFVVE